MFAETGTCPLYGGCKKHTHPWTIYNILKLVITGYQVRRPEKNEGKSDSYDLYPQWGRLKMKGSSLNRLWSSIPCYLFLSKFLWGLIMWHKMITKSRVFNNRYFSFMTCIHCGSAISLPLVQRAFSLDSAWWSSICRKHCLFLWQRGKKNMHWLWNFC